MINYYAHDLLYTGFVAFMQYLFWSALILTICIATIWVLYALFICCKQATSTMFKDEDE